MWPRAHTVSVQFRSEESQATYIDWATWSYGRARRTTLIGQLDITVARRTTVIYLQEKRVRS